MAEIGIKSLKANGSRVVSRVERGERVLITRYGVPAAVMLPVPEALDFVLAYANELVRARVQARDEHRAGGSIPLDRMQREAPDPRQPVD